jgi:ribosomal protein L32
MISKILTFLRSLFWHVYSGCPKSSQEVINHRYSICLQCDNYDAKNQECLYCGCNINNKKIFMNKLAWLDQKCPIDKW